MTITHAHVCEAPTWNALATARFWEPGVEEWARGKLYLPDGRHITGDDYDRLNLRPYRVAEGPTPGNLLTTVGLLWLCSQLVAGTKDWTTAFTGLAVGDGTAAAVVGNTDLSGASKSYRVMNATYPALYGATHPVTGVPLTQGQILFATTYGSGEANGAWDEYGVIVPTGSASALGGSATTSKPSNYILLNRRSPAGLGSKANGAPADLFVLITIV